MMLTFKQRAGLAWRVLKGRDSNSLGHADRELRALLPDGDKMNEAMREGVMEVLLVFATQGHSGFSASYATSLIEKLLRQEPLGPLTGADEEWMDCSYGGPEMWQNIRCSHVFKDADGRAFDINGIVFQDPDGSRYTSRESRVYIKFPYTPKTRIVKRKAEA